MYCTIPHGGAHSEGTCTFSPLINQSLFRESDQSKGVTFENFSFTVFSVGKNIVNDMNDRQVIFNVWLSQEHTHYSRGVASGEWRCFAGGGLGFFEG